MSQKKNVMIIYIKSFFFFFDIPLTKKYNIQHCNENINNNNKKKKRQQPPQIGKNCT